MSRPKDIVELIDSRGLTVIEVAAFLGITRQSVYNWKYGGGISDKNLNLLAHILNLNREVLEPYFKQEEKIR